jgi:hypothetical protein
MISGILPYFMYSLPRIGVDHETFRSLVGYSIKYPTAIADEYQQKQGKEVEKNTSLLFYVIKHVLYNKIKRINLDTAFLKQKGISFLPVFVLINIIQ